MVQRQQVFHVVLEGGAASRPSGDEHAVGHDARAWLPLLDALFVLGREGRRRLGTLVVPPAALLRWDDSRHLDRLARHAAALPADAPARTAFERLGVPLVEVLARLARDEVIELGTTALTGAFLPALVPVPSALRVQIEGALDVCERVVGLRPRVFWAPACGVAPEIEDPLARAGVALTLVTTAALAAHRVGLARLGSGLVVARLARGTLEAPADRAGPDVVAHDVATLGSAGLARLIASLWQSPDAPDASRPDTLSSLLDRSMPTLPVSLALSSTAPSGAAREWVNATTAPLMRHMHHAAREVARAAARHHRAGPATLAGRAMRAAVRESAWLAAATCEAEVDEARERTAAVMRLVAALDAGPEALARDAGFLALIERRDGPLDGWLPAWVADGRAVG
ncbi:MAG: hypothetical protein IT379_03790 [Deltaproteobacteria bacterium]|nr:hypothetical protein [Deltaproteobacteria bacterium]